jgi:hypothetical protein
MKKYTNLTATSRYVQIQIPNHSMVSLPVAPYATIDITDDQHKYVVSSKDGFSVQHIDDSNADTVEEIIRIISTTGYFITGMQGPTGATGVQGIQGDTGSQGSTGVKGVTGVVGATGITGNIGAQGTTGPQGARGVTGADGIQGVTGQNGLNGQTGATGIQGQTGTQGMTGVQGQTGARGITGAVGPTGADGVTGPQGLTGLQGAQGVTGARGLDGFTGTQGIRGVTGMTGNTGPQGPTGFDGPTGPQGQTGVRGTTGAQGTTDHDLLANLQNDTHPQYFRTDGLRVAGGDFDMGGFTLKNSGVLPGTTTTLPVTQSPDSANTEGTSIHKARADHVHNIPTAAPVGSLGGDSNNSKGVSTSFARADHLHDVATGTPVQITAGSANAEGSANGLARADHSHGISTAATVGSIGANALNTEGASASLARADHMHSISTNTPSTLIPAQVNSAGVSNDLARADHVHNIPVANPFTVGITNSGGTANSFSRSDHVHSHGNQTDPGQHAVATTLANGFMSTLDKIKLGQLSTSFIQYTNSSTLTNSLSTFVDMTLDDNRDSDTDGNFSKVDGTTFRCNFTGYVQVAYSVYSWPSTNDRGSSFQITKNGLSLSHTLRAQDGSNNTARGNTVAWSGIIPVTTNDVLRLQFSSTEGAATITINIGSAMMCIRAHKITG